MLLLQPRTNDSLPIVADTVAPDRLALLTPERVAAVPVQHGNRTVRLDEVFDIDGNGADADIRIEDDCTHVSLLGARMAGGRLIVDGSVGPHVGARMTGGEIEIAGDADDWAGAEMCGGMLRIGGSAGNRAGAAYPGSRSGMRGGVLLIEGSAGDDLGAAMRRGLIAVGGSCGNFAAAAVISGTIMLFGPIGEHLAAGLKRGTVMTFGPPPRLLPTFRHDCSYRPAIVDLYLRQLRDWGWRPAEPPRDGPVERHRGDFVELGKGDVLVWGAA